MDNVLGMIGLAKRAGKVVTGAEICEAAVKKGKSHLIIIAEDISENGKKAICDCCKFYKVGFIEYGKKSDLGRFTGSDERAVVSINDRGFAKTMLDKFASIAREE